MMNIYFLFFDGRWRRKKSASDEGGESLLKLARRNNLPIGHSCGGNGTCGTCRVVIKSPLSHLPARNEVEAEMARDRGFDSCERLACQMPCIDGLEVEIPTEHKTD